MATESFVATATGVSATTSILSSSVAAQGSKVYTRAGFLVRIHGGGVYISKAATFGAAQGALTFPLTRYAARELALELLRLTA
jgi:hypothetical protein